MTAAGASLTVPARLVVPDAFTLAIAGEFVMRRGRVAVAFAMSARPCPGVRRCRAGSGRTASRSAR